jgi:hypothetical protein
MVAAKPHLSTYLHPEVEGSLLLMVLVPVGGVFKIAMREGFMWAIFRQVPAKMISSCFLKTF